MAAAQLAGGDVLVSDNFRAIITADQFFVMGTVDDSINFPFAIFDTSSFNVGLDRFRNFSWSRRLLLVDADA